jgi:hypothetical protein
VAGHVNPINLLASALLFFLTQSPQQGTDTADWHTYASLEQGFEFKYPKHWQLANTRIDRANITFQFIK